MRSREQLRAIFAALGSGKMLRGARIARKGGLAGFGKSQSLHRRGAKTLRLTRSGRYHAKEIQFLNMARGPSAVQAAGRSLRRKITGQ